MAIEKEEMIYVRLLDEAVEVWRPVKARLIDNSRYELTEDQIPLEDEEWEFHPGEVIEVGLRTFDGNVEKIALRRI